MGQAGNAVRTGAHLAMVWWVGSLVSGFQLLVLLAALFTGWSTFALVAAVVVPSAVGLLACVGLGARPLVPFTRRTRGLWRWAATVYGLGTIGSVGALTVVREVGSEGSGPLLFAAGGLCHALAAALQLPGARTRWATLAVAAAVAAGTAYVVRDAATPPTLAQWVSDNNVDTALMRVGEPPPGYTLDVTGAGSDGFGARYQRTGSAGLHLHVARVGHDTRRTDFRGCPVPLGEPVHCTDDGDGRLLVVHGDGGDTRRELRLRRGGLVHTVTFAGSAADLPAARHVLSTLRPATDADLAGLPERLGTRR
ncbi:hypothetical protein [Streptomyces sparsus]